MKARGVFLSCVILFSFALCFSAHSQQLYRWVNTDGNVHHTTMHSHLRNPVFLVIPSPIGLFRISLQTKRVCRKACPERIIDGAQQTRNDFRGIGYGGPDSTGEVRKYLFRIVPLDVQSIRKPRPETLRDHFLGEATLTAFYP
ncbi:MAG: DUF4124 domain-containing protein [Proteobacteria bacterium]|nr:DUF4124 domain-containing protein [Pseudomonadota bacterium]NIS69766.1 DUF4124 domain-containing protein [Pseudomonadota bacterium]